MQYKLILYMLIIILSIIHIKKMNQLYNLFKLSLCIFFVAFKPKGQIKGLKEIIFLLHENINYKLALRAYIAQTYSEETDKLMTEIDTISFFDQKKQIKMDYPFDIKIWEIDLLSHQKPKCIIPPYNKRSFGIYIFLKYIDNAEQSKIKFPNKQKSIVIKLKDGIFTIEKISKRRIASDSKQKRKEFCIELPEDETLPLKEYQ